MKLNKSVCKVSNEACSILTDLFVIIIIIISVTLCLRYNLETHYFFFKKKRKLVPVCESFTSSLSVEKVKSLACVCVRGLFIG